IATIPTAGSDRAVDSSTGSAASGDLTSNGAQDLTLDFGFVKPSVSVGDYVWLDTNRDGLQDASENGIAGVTLTLTGPDGKPVTDVNGAVVAPVKTDASGKYLFTNLPALPAGQHYTVTVTPPAGYIATIPAAGSDRALDSSTGSVKERPTMSPMVNTTTSTTTKKANIRTMSRLFKTTVFSLELSLSRMRIPHR
ncbi:MAG TPA: SdrD B-like domain-containing protein, partial [Acidobacteriota bacterium]|nr:SdrD B-like domain-containing protein [Acidobacteriota bacterium]